MKKITHLIICSLLLVMAACEKDTEPANFAPKLATGEATNIYRTGATLSGSMEKAEGVVVKEYGILYSTLQSMAEYTEVKVGTDNEGKFSVQLQALEPGKTYYYCSYANSGYSIAKGETKSFTTVESKTPVFSDLQVSGTDEKSFIVSTSVLDDGGGEMFLSGFCWKETTDANYVPTEKDNTKNIDDVSNYQVRINDLKPGRLYAVRAYAINSNGRGYGTTTYVTTKATDLPVVSSCAPQDSTNVSITMQARILANSTLVTEKGFCYSSEVQEPTIANLKEISLVPDTTIYGTIGGLKPGNTYYIRAYAVSSLGVGYGDVFSYTIPGGGEVDNEFSVNTLSVEDISRTSALVRGKVNVSDLSSLIEFGLEWFEGLSDMGYVIIDNYPSANISQLTGEFSLQMSSLPSGKKIRVRAWARIMQGGNEVRAQGELLEFTTVQSNPAVVGYPIVSNVTVNSASVSAPIDKNEGGEITACGFYYSTVHDTPDSQDVQVSSSTAGNAATANLTGLEEGQTYYIRAYAVNEAGMSYGDVAVFRTVAVTLPVVKMNEITNVTPSSAKLYGTVTSAGSGIIRRKGFCWSNTQTSPLLGQDASCEVSTGEDVYSYALTGLSGKTKYYVRAYAENEKGISYSETAEFQTGSAAVIPTLSGTTVSEIGETSAKAVATVVSDGGISVSAKGFCYSSTNNQPTLEAGIVFSDASTGGSITGVLKDLEPNAKYYIRAYATNGEGTAYGVVNEFSTQKESSSTPTVGVTVINTVTKTTAGVASSITNDGGAAITERGFCYSTVNTTPTISDNKINSDISQKDFTGSLESLTISTQYYIRAYAVNMNGISYGETNSFTTRSDIPDNSDNQSPDKK